MTKKTKSKIEYSLFWTFYHVMKLLPYSLIRGMLAKIFQFGGMTFRLRKKVALRQLEMIFPDLPQNRYKLILKQMYRNMGITAAEIYFGKNENLFKTVSTKGWENLQQAVDQKKGVILASIHFGNWQLAGEYIAQFFKMSVIIKKQRNEYFHKFTYEKNIEENVELINQKNALRPILKLLRNNHIVSVMTDQSAGKRGVQTKFLGHLAATYIGAAKISMKTGSPVVPAVAVRNEDGSHTFVFEQMIDPSQFDSEVEFIEHISSKLEKYILQEPAQWFWVHRRWKGKNKAKKSLQNKAD